MKKKCQKNSSDKSNTMRQEREALFSVQEIEGRGKGMISVKNIQMGEVILTETPLLTIKHCESSNFEEWARRVVKLVEDLPKDKKEKYLNLADNEYFNSCPEFQYLKSVKNFRLESAHVLICFNVFFYKAIMFCWKEAGVAILFL